MHSNGAFMNPANTSHAVANPQHCRAPLGGHASALELRKAARRGDVQAVEAILAAGPPENVSIKGYCDPLCESIMAMARSLDSPARENAREPADHFRCAQLLAPMASLGAIWDANSPPLTLATFLGVSEVVELLAPLHGPAHKSTLATAMAGAAGRHDLKSCLALAKALAPMSSWTDIMLPSMRHGFIELLQATATPELARQLNSSGMTPLMVAAMSGFTEAARYLIPLSDLSQLSSRGEDALHIAAREGSADSLELLLAAAAPQSRGWLNSTPLLAAARAGAAPCVKILISCSDVHARGHDGLTALMLAAQANSIGCARLLASRNTCSDRDSLGRMAEDIARSCKSHDVSMFLAETRCRWERDDLATIINQSHPQAREAKRL